MAKVLLILIALLSVVSLTSLPYNHDVFAQTTANNNTDTSPSSNSNPSITITSGFAHFSYGIVGLSVIIENPIPGVDKVSVKVYNPDDALIKEGDETLHINSFDGKAYFSDYYFGVERKYVEDNYRIVATYADQSETNVMQPFSSEFPQPPTIVAFRASQTSLNSVAVDGRVAGGLAGEEVTVSIYPSDDNSPLWSKTVGGNLKDQFGAHVDTSEAVTLFSTGTYRVVATHVPTGISGETTFTYTNPESSQQPQQQPPSSSEPEPPSSTGKQDQEVPSDSSSREETSTENEADEEDLASTTTIAEASVIDDNTIAINGTLASFIVLDTAAPPSPLYFLSGNWGLIAVDEKVTDFTAYLTMVRTDGKDNQSYSFVNFTAANDNPVNIQQNDTIITITGIVDIQKDGTIVAGNVNAAITLENLYMIKLDLADDQTTHSTWPIYGTIDSIVCDGEELTEVASATDYWISIPLPFNTKTAELSSCFNEQ